MRNFLLSQGDSQAKYPILTISVGGSLKAEGFGDGEYHISTCGSHFFYSLRPASLHAFNILHQAAFELAFCLQRL